MLINNQTHYIVFVSTLVANNYYNYYQIKMILFLLVSLACPKHFVLVV